MAVFNKKVPTKVCLDDTEALTVTIENAQTVSGHTEYVIKVHRGPYPEQSWIVCKRYSDFVALHSMIQGSGINVVLPPKKLFGNMDRAFIAQRQVELQNYVNQILMNHILALSLPVRRFLDPQSYTVPLEELALQHVSMALRSEVQYELVNPIAELGWRLRKHYFFIKSKLMPKTELLLQWVEFGPDKSIDDKELQSVLQCLVNLNHPHLEKLEFSHCSDGGCFIVRKFNAAGTLRDIIYGSKPKHSFLKKYGNSNHSKPLSLSDISIYGRQILETLIFLHEKGIPFGHLHLGNILLIENNIKLLDIENAILGLPSFYRPFIVHHKRINTMEAIDVYSFGHVLFEMAFGYPLNESVCDNLPSTCPPLLSVLLESILSTESRRSGLPTLHELLQHPFFNVSATNNFVKPSLKLSSCLKHSLKAAIQSTEKRLQGEQKAIRHQKKMARMQELLVSDEDLSKTKYRLKEPRNTGPHLLGVDQGISNGRRSPRSDSLTSNSTSTSLGAITPPLSDQCLITGMKLVLDQKTQSASQINSPTVTDGHSALLESICSFDKSVLHHPTTVSNSS
ncbi:hypothetical protein RUM44_011295 [Polyplax serrata]|uniref:PX domain-containing protein kinase-like protein n=1 Tax=Polyplax serrata TaxID=468196 RepID=A0ABR1APQ3_POLSC